MAFPLESISMLACVCEAVSWMGQAKCELIVCGV